MNAKRRFIAGAACMQCKAMDRVVLVTTPDDEWIECIACHYTERRPTAIAPDAPQLPHKVTNSPLKADEIGVVQFRPGS